MSVPNILNTINILADFDPTKLSLRYMNKAYRIYYKSNKLKFKTSICTLPFGIEKYGNKYIANLEFDATNNEQHNYLAFIKHIDKLFSNIIESKINVPNGFTNEIKNMHFSLSLKDRENNKVHHRCHIKTNCDTNNIKDNLIAEIELDHIWIHDNMFGIVWMITNIQNQTK